MKRRSCSGAAAPRRVLLSIALALAAAGCGLTASVSENTAAVRVCTETIAGNTEHVQATSDGMHGLAERLDDLEAELAELKGVLQGVRELRPALESAAELKPALERVAELGQPMQRLTGGAVVFAVVLALIAATCLVYAAAWRGAQRVPRTRAEDAGTRA